MHLSATNLLHMYEVRELLEDKGARRSTQRFDSLRTPTRGFAGGCDQRVGLKTVLTGPVTLQYSWRTGIEKRTK